MKTIIKQDTFFNTSPQQKNLEYSKCVYFTLNIVVNLLRGLQLKKIVEKYYWEAGNHYCAAKNGLRLFSCPLRNRACLEQFSLKSLLERSRRTAFMSLHAQLSPLYSL